MLKVVMYLISAAMGIVLFMVVQAPAQGADIPRVYAERATSRHNADIIYYNVDAATEKWYIGECFGDIVIKADIKLLYEEYHKGPEIQEVEIVYNKFDADLIICVK